MLRLLRRLRATARIAPRGRDNAIDAVRYLIRRPALLSAVAGYEVATLLSNRVDPRLKHLAVLKTSGRVGCPF